MILCGMVGPFRLGRAASREGAWTQGREGAWTQGREGAWTQGREGAWTQGRVGRGGADPRLRGRPGRAYAAVAMNPRAILAGPTLGRPAPAAARAPIGLILLRLIRPWA
jgi:hypothetical protein